MKKSYLLTFTSVFAIGILISSISFLASLGILDNWFSLESISETGRPSGLVIFGRRYSLLWLTLSLLGDGMILTSVFALIFHKSVSRSCSIVTSTLSLILSALGSCGLVFGLLTIGTTDSYAISYPNAHPTFCFCSILCLILCWIVMLIYFMQWFKQTSFLGLLYDFLLTITFLPAFFFINYAALHALWDVLKLYI